MASDLLKPEDKATIQRAREAGEPLSHLQRDQLHKAINKAENIMRLSQATLSLDTPVSSDTSDSEARLGDFIEDKSKVRPTWPTGGFSVKRCSPLWIRLASGGAWYWRCTTD